MQWKQGSVEANGREENNEDEESIREVAITALCGATADTSAQRSVWVRSRSQGWCGRGMNDFSETKFQGDG